MRLLTVLIYSLLFTSLIELLRLIKGNFIVGSTYAFFSLSHCCSPIIGEIGGLSTSWLVLVWRTLIIMATLSYKHILLVYHIPTFCGALYYKRYGLLTTAIIGFCFLFFLIHPTGWAASWYSIYWLIPLITTLLPHNNSFLDALGSTFTVHAVGSVLWLYTHTMSPETWLNLIPLVAAERLLYASGMTLSLHIWHKAQDMCTTVYHKTALFSKKAYHHSSW